MKIVRKLLIAATAIILAASTHSFAIVGLDIGVAGTNVVISWPSQGNEYYLIQYRPTLDPSIPWENLTNNYPANSTNLTTFTIFGVVPPPADGQGGDGGSSPPPGPNTASQRVAASPTEPLAMPADGSGAAVPLKLYPPGFDLSDFIIYDPVVSDWVKASEYSRDALAFDGLGDPQPENSDSGGSSTNCRFYRVFHIPDWTFNVTNYTYDGPMFFPVDFKDCRERVDNIEVLLDGVPTSDAVYIPYVSQGQTNWGMGIYFDLFTNGTHQIQLRTTLHLNDEIGDSTVNLVLSNLVRTIVVDNEVTFADWEDLILSTNTTFRAQTKTNTTDWWIDIYDAWDNYVNGGSGHTTNGLIEWTWDLTDTFGTPRDSLDNDPFFTSFITFSTAAGPQTTRYTPAKQIEYPEVGGWLVSYSDRHYLDAGAYYAPGDEYYTNGIIAIQGGPGYRGIPNSRFAIKFGTSVYTQAERNASWQDLTALMFSEGRIRNFYYYGHGSANKIGTDIHTFDTNGFVTGGTSVPGSKAFLTSQSVSNQITFNRYGGSRPYRFVWLDGCSTANGNWPGAFGVNKATNTISGYTNSVTNPTHRRPSAFVGWNQTVGGQPWGTVDKTWQFRSEWMQDWYYNWQTRTLVDAFTNARQSANWPPGGDAQLWGALRVYGYTDMKMNEYNRKEDWRWP